MSDIEIETGKKGRWGPAVLLVAVVLAAGVAASVTLAGAALRAEQRYAGQLMDRYAADVSAALTDEVDRYGQTLSDIAAAVAAQPHLTATSFARMTQGLNTERLPGAGGIGFVVPTTTRDIGAAQAIWRARGAQQLRLTAYGSSVEHNFVIFQRLFDGGTPHTGLDLNRSPEATTAMYAARDGGTFAVSPPYILLRDRVLPAAQQQTSVVLAAPIHDGVEASTKNLMGWIVMSVRGSDFLTQSLHARSQGTVRVTLTDPAERRTAIARATPGAAAYDDAMTRERTLTVGQRHWQLTVTPTTRLLSTTDRRMSVLVLGAGLAGTLLIAALVGVLAGSRNRAMDKVDRATANLREDIERRQIIEQRLREREIELQRLAFHDPLTGLANRILFYERVGHALLTHARNGQ
ncbi:MAG: CHASE domain-containing protein, partial [Phycisphaerae bacterium]|nr:CHASE domain-containing protein [Phycisphaerae bacterium]